MFEGIMVDIICKINTSYYDKIIWSKAHKKKFLYGRLIKAVYGTLLGAIIFYKKKIQSPNQSWICTEQIRNVHFQQDGER